MLAEISAGLSSLNAAKDIVKALNGAQTAVAVNEVKMELQGLILDAQSALFSAQEAKAADARRIAELEQQIASFENWETEKQRYQLQAIDTGAFAYMHKLGMENGEPAVWLCQTCFDNRHTSPLQFRAQDRGGGGASSGRGTHSRWGCNLCKAEVVVHYTRRPQTPWSGSGEPLSPSAGMGSVKIERC